MTDPEIVAAFRFAAWALMLAQVLLIVNVCRIDMGRPIRDQIAWFQPYLPQILCGLLLTSVGWTMHQFYWWLAELAKAAGRLDINSWFSSASLITTVFFTIVYAGVVLIFAGWLAQYVGRWWPLAGLGVVVMLLAIGGLSA